MNIKTKCVAKGCDQKLPGTLGFFLQNGNFCTRCNSEAEKASTGKNGLRRQLVNRRLLSDY